MRGGMKLWSPGVKVHLFDHSVNSFTQNITYSGFSCWQFCSQQNVKCLVPSKTKIYHLTCPFFLRNWFVWYQIKCCILVNYMSIFCCPQPLQRYFDITICIKYPIKAIYWIFSCGNMFTIWSIFKDLLVEHHRGTIFHPGSPSRGYKPQTKIFSQETAHLQKGRCFSQGSLYSLLSCELGQHLNGDVESTRQPNWSWHDGSN